MGRDPGRFRKEMKGVEKEKIREILKSSGAVAVGFAESQEADCGVSEEFLNWIQEGNNAGMKWMEKHLRLRKNPENVLPGVKTVICLAFSFVPEENLRPGQPEISCYAFGKDYHDVIKQRLRPLISEIKKTLGGEWRICIDSAPLAERYWALRSGIGIKGKNGSVIVEGCGCYCFLAEVLTTLEIPADEPSKRECEGCGECWRNCPGNALNDSGKIDCRKCLSYLTIEHRGEWDEDTKALMGDDRNQFLFGCDRCLKACPHNKNLKPTQIDEFKMADEIRSLTFEKISTMTEAEFKSLFKFSPLKRAGLENLKRNIRQEEFRTCRGKEC